MKEEGGLAVWANKRETISSRRTLTKRSSVCLKMPWARLEWKDRAEEQISAPQNTFTVISDWVDEQDTRARFSWRTKKKENRKN